MAESKIVGDTDGCGNDGCVDGLVLGCDVDGLELGFSDGLDDGLIVVGKGVGTRVGNNVGTFVGSVGPVGAGGFGPVPFAKH